jgi:hypothetical protein
MAYKLIEAAQSRWRAVNAPTWSPSSAPEPNSRTANPSNDATNQEVKFKPRNTPIHSLENISGKPFPPTHLCRTPHRLGCTTAN